MIISSRELAADAVGGRQSYDYIVCGAGSAGCALAARLSEHGRARVLLVEAGGDGNLENVADVNRWPRNLGSDLDWNFKAEPNANLEARSIAYNMGKVLGGGSSINVGTWSRGHRADWDHFAAQTQESAWSYDAIRQLYIDKIEAWTGEPDQLRGSHGAMHVQPGSNPHPFASAVLASAEAVGIPRFPNANGRMMEADRGCSVVDEIVQDGRRRSVYRAYVEPLLKAGHLTVVTGVIVNRVVVEGHRAVGIECYIDGQAITLRAEVEVLLSLGAINTPRVLMHSGIGNAGDLRTQGIAVTADLPSVGRNLHDHVAFGCVWGSTRDDLPPVPRSQISCFWKTDAELESPNAYAYARRGPDLTPENAVGRTLPASTWSMIVGVRLAGRGQIRLTGSDMNAPVQIDNGFLSGSDDMAKVVAASKVAREIGNHPLLAEYRTQEFAPGHLTSAELETFLRRGLGTFWHQSGTARMGADASNSVVDGRLRVYGIEGLRVVDSSVLPRVTTGNTMAPCVAIGEVAANFIKDAA